MNFAEVSSLLSAEIGKDMAEKAIRAIRKFAPGETIYIPSRQPRPVVTARDTPQTLMKRGIPRRTAYKWVTGK